MEKIGIKIPHKFNTRNEITNIIKKYINTNRLELENLERLERLEMQNLESLGRLQNLESLGRLQNLELTNLSYNDVKIKGERCIYCDIPYKNTAKYQDNFDHDKFYEWCLQQNNIYISEYQMPEDFKCILEIKRQNIFGQKQDRHVIEKLFTPRNNPNYKEVKHIEYEEW